MLGVTVVHQKVSSLQFGNIITDLHLYRSLYDRKVLLGPGIVGLTGQLGVWIEGNQVHLQVFDHGEWTENLDFNTIVSLLKLRSFIISRIEGEDSLWLGI